MPTFCARETSYPIGISHNKPFEKTRAAPFQYAIPAKPRLADGNSDRVIPALERFTRLGQYRFTASQVKLAASQISRYQYWR